MTIKYVKETIEASIEVKELLLNDEQIMSQITDLSKRCIDSLNNGGKIIFCGNGGSFADSQHLSAEFTSRFLFDRPGLPSIALGTNSSSMTAIGNDYGYDNVFSREIESIANEEDVIIAITTSGNSGNILRAIEAAKSRNVYTVILTGAGNGRLPQDIESINVPSTDTARIQESHILIGHIICGLAEEAIFGDKKPK